MIYLSKGIAQKDPTEKRISIFRYSQVSNLTGLEAALWSNGRYSFAVTQLPLVERELIRLEKMGLVETEVKDSYAARYRILTRCICCPVKASGISFSVSGEEKILLTWLKCAGIRLTVAELIYLREHQVEPRPELLYEDNRQALVETIYTRETIADNLLEYKMEVVACRDKVVSSLLRLLKKKKILML